MPHRGKWMPLVLQWKFCLSSGAIKSKSLSRSMRSQEKKLVQWATGHWNRYYLLASVILSVTCRWSLLDSLCSLPVFTFSVTYCRRSAAVHYVRACVNRWDRSLPLLPRQATASSGASRTSRFPVGLALPSVGQQAGPRCSP